MPESLRLRFSLTEDEYASAMWTHAIQCHRLKASLAVCAIGNVVTLLTWFFIVRELIPFLLFILTLLMTVFLLYLYILRPRRAFRRDPNQRQERTILFAEDGIAYETGDATPRARG